MNNIIETTTQGELGEFVHLHVHTEYSLLDGKTKIKDLADELASRGATACAITDHGVMYGTHEAFKEFTKRGIKPIIGCEFYTKSLDGSKDRNHLILLAKNQKGAQNLRKLLEESYDPENFYSKPHVPLKSLEAHSEGVICLSGCLGGSIPRALKKGDYDLAMEYARFFKNIYGEDFYIEIQRHEIEIEKSINAQLLILAKNLGIEVVATSDSHYLNKEDKEAHEVLLCIATKKTMDDPSHFSFDGTNYHLLTNEEAHSLYGDIPQAISNTRCIADKCSMEVLEEKIRMPKFPIPATFASEEAYLTHLASEGFRMNFAGTEKIMNPVYHERFSYEMSVINKMGFPGYFLIVQDYINFARSKGIYVGPGRGSAAGSLVAFCLGITDLDPIEFDLLFERFLNPDRISMPDIDTDFEHSRRGEVQEYIREKYGKDKVCGIATFGTLAAKMACKDVAKALGYDVATGVRIAKLIPDEVGMTIKMAINNNPELAALIETDSDVAKIVSIAQKVEGLKRHVSQHACGMIISPSAVSDHIPTMLIQGELVAQHNMSECEEQGSLKMDLLGLKNLTVMHDTLTSIEKNIGAEAVLDKIKSSNSEVRYHDIPLNDRATYTLLAKGLTGGVFQLESPGMTKMIVDMFSDIDNLSDEDIGVQCFERLIAAVALYRPGPMDSIPSYIAGMRDQSKIHYDHESLKEILAPTYGIIVYQEQVIQIVKSLAGFSGGQADDVRKAMGKKIAEKMEKAHKIFIHGNKEAFEAGDDKHYAPGCIANGIPENIATIIWEKMADFAKYAFNRSHAACYAWISYLTAYMSCHMGEHFYSGMLTSYSSTADKFKDYLSQVALRGFKLLPPSVNTSSVNFSAMDGKISYSLQGIKGVNSLANVIETERLSGGVYTSPDDLMSRLRKVNNKCPKGSWEGLAYSGALDCFGFNRREITNAFSEIEASCKANAEAEELGQLSFFSAEERLTNISECKDFTTKQKLELEFEVLGIYVSGHPLDDVVKKLTPVEAKTVGSIDLFPGGEEFYGKKVGLIGQVKNVSPILTKKGDRMCSFILQGKYKEVKCVVFPKQYQMIGHIKSNSIVGIVGNYATNGDFGPQLIVDSLTSGYEDRKEDSLIITVTDKGSQEAALNVLKSAPAGNISVFLKAKGQTKLYRLSFAVEKTSALMTNLANWEYSACTL